ncbi:protein phosphatase 1 regulatory subunit 12A-like isoform X2 [Rhinatrema bivittatum]|uniref:protein phosphatase 1 regulatory subunit 12A-like isoform X2 n=1 Tax=Rhinatrema bivittatum TaxID=194408 RepID=UPI0011293B94|nr:protein phosphatase 1 regulatory subunit 12A-like isoform X2 [Rhinatrema bivittatum]
MAAEDRCRSDAARQKRREQLSRWLGSETDRAEPRASGAARLARVRFAQGAVFMAACSAGERAEVRTLLAAGADINGTNVDGLTALHQACIDENFDMVQFLVENGAYVNQPDNEGWTPLHAAASCGFVEIAEYLIKHGAKIAAVNSEGELPLDVAHENAMEKLLKAEIKKQGIDLEVARQEEEQLMVRDARQWVNKGKLEDIRHPKTGATALHVAAAKGYVEVMKLLFQLGFDVNICDNDGWTPLHAAAHWGQQEACRLLVEELCNMEAVNKVGQTPFDVVDESAESLLEELKKKQSELRIEKEKQKKSPPLMLIETSAVSQNPAGRTRRSSISRMSSKEKISLHDKERKTLETLEPVALERLNDEEEEAKKEESSSSSSEEEEEASESESEAESEKVKTRERLNNMNNKLNSTSVSAPSTTNTTSTSTTSNRRVPTSKDEEKPGTAPSAWRTSLRKTGSYGALSTAVTSAEESKGKEAGLPKSASSPRLTSTELAEAQEKDGKEPRLARVPPTPTRRLFNNQDSIPETTNRDSLSQLVRGGSNTRLRQGGESSDSTGGLSRTSSYTRRYGESEGGKRELGQSSDVTATGPTYLRSNSYLLAVGRVHASQDLSPNPTTFHQFDSHKILPSQRGGRTLVIRSSSFGRRTEDALSTSTSVSAPSSRPVTGGLTARSVSAGTFPTRTAGRSQPGEGTAQKEDKTPAGTAPNPEAKERRRSYLTPVRDEEAEAQRKARSRHARQSRRSTQGVTLTDLKEAEKTIKGQQEGKPEESKGPEQEGKEKADEIKDNQSKPRMGRVGEDGAEVSWRSRIASLQKSDLLGLTSPSDPPRATALGGSTSLNRQGASQPLDNKELEKSKEEEKDSDDKGSRSKLGIRDRRRPRGKRRSTGVPLMTKDSDDDGSEEEEHSGGGEGEEQQQHQVDGLSSRGSAISNDLVLTRGGETLHPRATSTTFSALDDKDGEKRDFKKMYEDLMRDNGRIRTQLEETQILVTKTKVELEKASQRQERNVDKSVLLETEKKEKMILQRRISELEEELKVLADLKADNQRLKDENGALIRVISKLSK